MIKTYTSPSALSFNVRLADGFAHLTFIPHTLGGSSFTTADTRLQEAIENHRYFGTIIQMEKPLPLPPLNSRDLFNPAAGDSSPAAPKEIAFFSLADAKDYVATQWDVSRTKLRTRAQIEEAALEHGVIIKIQS